MEVPKLADLNYAHTLVIKGTHEYKVHGPYDSNFPCSMGAMGSLLAPDPGKLRRESVGPMVHGKLKSYGTWSLYS